MYNININIKEMIDNVDYKSQTVDEGVREIINTLRELEKNLVT